jgi:hypothetical protein
MASSTIEVDASTALREVTIEVDLAVTGVWLARLRLFVAILLMRLAGWVSGMTIDLPRASDVMKNAFGEHGTVPAGYPLAADVNDPGFDFEPFQHVDILLDGELASECVAYSVMGGWVRVAVLDADGQIQLDAASENILYERRFGRVDLRLKQPD